MTVVSTMVSNEISKSEVLYNEIASSMLIKVDLISKMIDEIKVKLQYNSFGLYYNQMIESTKKMSLTIIDSCNILLQIELFKCDFSKSLQTINNFLDCFLRSLKIINNYQDQINLISLIQVEINSYSQYFLIFSFNFVEIMEKIQKNKSNSNEISIQFHRLGIEFVLFNLSVNLESSNEFPYFKSKFTEIYKCYNTINKISQQVHALKSFCGTGKTFCVPLILLSRSLKDDLNAPFCILIQPTSDQVDIKAKYFNKIISKYAKIETNIEVFNEMIKNNEESKYEQKIVIGILTPFNLLTIMHNFNDKTKFYSKTRIIIDDIHKRSIQLDVLIAKIAYLNYVHKSFSLPLNVVFMSSSIPAPSLYPFHGTVGITSLIGHSKFEVVDKNPVIGSSITQINNEIVYNETVKSIEKMANINSNIKEGNIICFLSDINICKKLIKSIILSLNNNEETDDRKKIIVLQTYIKTNETLESFYKRLKIEYQKNESSRKENNYKYEFIYYFAFIFSNNEKDEELMHEFAFNEFPDELKSINKLILTTNESAQFNNVSVVIDSGLIKEAEFDYRSCLTRITEKQASKELMNQRKAKLGKSMNGLYVPILLSNEIPDFSVSQIERLDLAYDLLLLKSIDIDLEKMKNLPNKPNHQSIRFSIDNLKYIGAIDKKSSKITQLGVEILKFSFIPFYYSVSIYYFKETFPTEDKKSAYFVASYISTIISMESDLLQEEMSEKLIKIFCEDSDIITLFKALNIILKSDLNNDQELFDFVESFGFSFSSFLSFKSHLQEIVNEIFPGKTVHDVIIDAEQFINKYEGISSIIDKFIYEIEGSYPNWSNIHYIDFNYVNDIENHSILVFKANRYLKFGNQKNAEINILSRPGWNGIAIPLKCYCFNISQDENLHMNTGHLIHRVRPNFKEKIESVEITSAGLNKWFRVLIETYFKNENINISYLRILNSNLQIENRLFHFSNTDGSFFISFIPHDEKVKLKILFGANCCNQIMPFTPRSILVFRHGTQSLVEIMSISTQSYETYYSNYFPGDKLDKKKIDYCIKHLDELKKSNSHIRICALFIKETCKLNEYDQNNLYFINSEYKHMNYIEEIIPKCIKIKENESIKSNKYNLNGNLSYFQFPNQLIHPALVHHQESLNSIMKWFTIYCPYVHIIKVIGHRFLIKSNEISELKENLQNLDMEHIKEQMNMNYIAIPVPSKIYSKVFLSIRENPAWNYDEKFKVIITTKEEGKNVNDFLEKVKIELDSELTSKNNEDYSSIKALGCCYICDDPENPNMTELPITVYNKDGSTYTNKMCRDCLFYSLQHTTDLFYKNGKIDQNAIENIIFKPAVIPSVSCKEYKRGKEFWPQIPLGQIISVLINNDEELSNLVSVWLYAVTEYAIRSQMKQILTFCPDHPHKVYNVLNISGKGIKCNIYGCKNTYCVLCATWHPPNHKCNKFYSHNICPKCKSMTFKDGGCNHVSCPCGCHWCFLCGAGFSTSSQCYEHLNKAHSGFWS